MLICFWDTIGTDAKRSAFVGPRTPFAMDPIYDYSIDEGVEWEAPEDELDLGDAVNGNESEKSESDADEDEDDADSWMCDDDEIEMMEGFDASFDAGIPMDVDEGFMPPPPSSKGKGKGKAKEEVKEKNKEKEKPKKGEPHRKVELLVPFSCGPIWEDVIGEDMTEKAYAGFGAYQIRLLNGEYTVG